MVRFLDASIFLSAFIKPLRDPPEDVAEMKNSARLVVSRIQEGETVVTTIVHVSEIANVLESRAGLKASREIILGLVSKENVGIVPVTSVEYSEAITGSEKFNVGINDALAYNVMLRNCISEVYSLDKHFEKLPGISRIMG